MPAATVMRHPPQAARFFVNGRGALMERQAQGPARRTRYGIEASAATRSEILALADLLNADPALDIDADADAIERLWALRIERPAVRGPVFRPFSAGARHASA